MQFRSALIASAVVALANAQVTVETSSASSVAATATQSQIMPPAATQAFNSNNVSSTDKFNWCHAQLNSCPEICGGSASQNMCDDTTLMFTCVCANGTVPDSTAFIQTLPYFICQATYIQCINNNPNNAQGQQTCMDNEQCGTRNATAELLQAQGATTSSAAGTVTSATAGASSTGSSSASASATGGSSGASMTTYSSGAFAAVLMAAFKLFL